MSVYQPFEQLAHQYGIELTEDFEVVFATHLRVVHSLTHRDSNDHLRVRLYTQKTFEAALMACYEAGCGYLDTPPSVAISAPSPKPRSHQAAAAAIGVTPIRQPPVTADQELHLPFDQLVIELALPTSKGSRSFETHLRIVHDTRYKNPYGQKSLYQRTSVIAGALACWANGCGFIEQPSEQLTQAATSTGLGHLLSPGVQVNPPPAAPTTPPPKTIRPPRLSPSTARPAPTKRLIISFPESKDALIIEWTLSVRRHLSEQHGLAAGEPGSESFVSLSEIEVAARACRRLHPTFIPPVDL